MYYDNQTTKVSLLLLQTFTTLQPTRDYFWVATKIRPLSCIPTTKLFKTLATVTVTALPICMREGVVLSHGSEYNKVQLLNIQNY